MTSVKIDRYTTVTNFTTAGSGSATWCFAMDKDGKEVFLKKFLSPVMPSKSTELPAKVREGRIKTCKDFYLQKESVYNAVRRAANNNIIVPREIFQHEGHYYVVSDRVHMEDMTIDMVSRLSQEHVLRLIRVMAHCLMQLEAQGVVHADLKPDNFLIKGTAGGGYTLKLIDFDASYLVSNPPKPGEEIQCDTVYVAPETLQFMFEEPASLTSKVDVFAFAIIMHQMFTGRLPAFDSKYDSVCQAVLEGGKIGVDSTIPEPYRSLIIRSLERDPDKRPTLAQMQKVLLSDAAGAHSSGSAGSSGGSVSSSSSAISGSSATSGSSGSSSTSGRLRIYISPSLRTDGKEKAPEKSTPPERGKHMKPLKGF